MMSILKKIKINNWTWVFVLIALLCGYIKNIFIVFIICLFHELGHVFFIRLFKYKIIKIELFPFGGWTIIDKRINSSITKDIIISVGGFINQIILFLFIYSLRDYLSVITYNLIYNYNFIILIFNILPIVPLDGYQIIHLLLEKYFSYYKAYILSYIVSLLSLIIFIIYIYKTNYYNTYIIVFLIYKLVEDIKNFKYMVNRFLIERYLGEFKYKKINNRTKSIRELRKEVYHYFKKDNKYISEKNKIKEHLYRKFVDI